MSLEHVRTLNCIFYGLVAVIGSVCLIVTLLVCFCRLGQPSDDVGDNA